jgi:hypothetical protein
MQGLDRGGHADRRDIGMVVPPGVQTSSPTRGTCNGSVAGCRMPGPRVRGAQRGVRCKGGAAVLKRAPRSERFCCRMGLSIRAGCGPRATHNG